MKKSLLGLLLSALIVLPVFAADTNDVTMDIVAKAGYMFTPEITEKVNGDSISTSKDSTFALGAEALFNINENIALGAGLIYGANSKTGNDYGITEIGFTDVYVTVKPRMAIEGTEDLYVYAIGQIGAGVPGFEYVGVYSAPEIDAGLYWGLGAGVEYKKFLVELLYSCNYGTIKSGSREHDFSYTAFRINVGYRFSLS